MMVDVEEPFFKATYNLEGDGVLLFTTYTTLQGMATAAAKCNYPNMVAQASTPGSPPEDMAALKAHARHAVEPGVNFFLQKLNVQFYVI